MAPDARHSLAGPNVATLAPRRQRPGGCNPRPCTARWQAPDADFKQPPHRHSGARLLARARNPYSHARLALGPFAQNHKQNGFCLVLPRMRQAASAVVVMDSGLAASRRPGMTRELRTYFRVPAARSARVLQIHTPQKTEGAGNAGCWPHPQPCVQR